jgi:hypothetical protein
MEYKSFNYISVESLIDLVRMHPAVYHLGLKSYSGMRRVTGP